MSGPAASAASATARMAKPTARTGFGPGVEKPPLGVHIDHHHTTEDVVCRNQDPLAIRSGW